MARTDIHRDDQVMALVLEVKEVIAAVAAAAAAAVVVVAIAVADTVAVRDRVAVIVKAMVSVVAAAVVEVLAIHLVGQTKCLERFSNNMRQTVDTNTKPCTFRINCIWFLFLRLKL